MVPLSNISLPFYSIGLPLISRLCATPDRYRKNFTELFEKLAMVVVPLGVFTALAADWITVLLFGPEWTSAAPVVAWFGLAIAYQPLISAVTLLFMSQDRAGELMAAMALDTAVAIASVCIGIPFGATGVAAAIAIGGACIRTPAVFFLATWRGPVRWSDLWQAIAPSVLGTAASAGALWAVRHLAGHPSSPGNGLMGAALAASVAAVLVYAIIPKTRRTIFDVVKLPQLLLNSGT
jgi:PST family polysaccharide transporter